MPPRRSRGRRRSSGGAGRRGGALTVRITGLANLRTSLEELPEEIRAGLRDAVRASAEAVRDQTRQTVPVDTGRLRDSVGIEYGDGGLTARVGWTDPRDFYATFVEHGTRRAPARPSLGPALEAERSRAQARITAEVRRHLR